MQGGQGMVANTRVYLSPIGKPRDVEVIQRYFQENFWIKGLIDRDETVIWQYPYDRPHAYLLTQLEAYLDLYLATGEQRYLAAVEGGWDLFHKSWENTGGSISIVEGENDAPGSNKLYAKMGENCGSAFWILLNQRLHQLRPDEEKYVTEIEKSIYNVILANQDGSHGYRYHTELVGQKEPSTRVNTCCEGQGTRLIGSLPSFIYSMDGDGFYVNLFEPSMLTWGSSDNSICATLHTEFPRSGRVYLQMRVEAPLRAVVRIRIPSWASSDVMVSVNDAATIIGRPGTYAVLDRIWNNDDRISFVLPVALRATRYSGSDQIQGRQRVFLEFGPFLMAAVGSAEMELAIAGDTDPITIAGQFEPDAGNASHFVLSGSETEFSFPVTLIPYLEVTNQSFSCVPIVATEYRTL